MKKIGYMVLVLLHCISFCHNEHVNSEKVEICFDSLRVPTKEQVKDFYENDSSNSAQQQAEQQKTRLLIMPDKWMVQSAMSNAPQLLKGVFSYLQSFASCCMGSKNFSKNWIIPSSHRFLLVGPSGSGKTTLAYALADMLGWKTTFQPASGLFGRYRNETSKNIQAFFSACMADGSSKIIIIDELHKLFEHHEDDHSDDSQSAVAFWQRLDLIEKYHPEIVIIGTANSVDTLPAELKSRFAGKVITIALPGKQRKIQAFKDIIAHDNSVKLHSSVNDSYISKLIGQIPSGSLRHMQLLIDTAKMFYYAEDYTPYDFIVLTKKHFDFALQQLQAEDVVIHGSAMERLRKKLEKWGVVFSVAANVVFLMRTTMEFYHRIPSPFRAKYQIEDYSRPIVSVSEY